MKFMLCAARGGFGCKDPVRPEKELLLYDTESYSSSSFFHRPPARFPAGNQCVTKNITANSTPMTQVPTLISFVFPVNRHRNMYEIRPNAMP